LGKDIHYKFVSLSVDYSYLLFIIESIQFHKYSFTNASELEFAFVLFYADAPNGVNSALPNRTENALHHIKTVSYFDISVPAGIGELTMATTS